MAQSKLRVKVNYPDINVNLVDFNKVMALKEYEDYKTVSLALTTSFSAYFIAIYSSRNYFVDEFSLSLLAMSIIFGAITFFFYHKTHRKRNEISNAIMKVNGSD